MTDDRHQKTDDRQQKSEDRNKDKLLVNGFNLQMTEWFQANHFRLWADTELIRRFRGRILADDFNVAQKWGYIQASSEIAGHKMPVIDSLIAATALVYDMTIVTRDTGGMEKSGVKLFNPWK